MPADFLKAIGVDAGLLVKMQAPPVLPAVVPYTPLAEVERAVQQRMAGIDVEALARRAIEEAYDRARGRV